MGYHIYAIEKAIRPLFADRVTYHDHQGQVRCQQTYHWGDSGKTDQVYFGVGLVG